MEQPELENPVPETDGPPPEAETPTLSEMAEQAADQPPSADERPAPEPEEAGEQPSSFDPDGVPDAVGWNQALRQDPNRVEHLPLKFLDPLLEDRDSFMALPQRAREELYERKLALFEVELEEAKTRQETAPTTDVPELGYRQGWEQAQAHWAQRREWASKLSEIDGELKNPDKFAGDWPEFERTEPQKAQQYRELEFLVKDADRVLGQVRLPTPSSFIQAELDALGPLSQTLVANLPQWLQQKQVLNWDDYWTVRNAAVQLAVEERVKGGKNETVNETEKPDADTERQRKVEAILAKKRAKLPRAEASNGRTTRRDDWDSYIDLNQGLRSAFLEEAKRD